MNAKQIIARLFAGALLSASMLAGPSFAAPNDSGFSALQGVSAQPLSGEEMQAISGELNAWNIAAALLASAAVQAGAHPILAAAETRLANYYINNADLINARYLKLGVLTPCTATRCS